MHPPKFKKLSWSLKKLYSKPGSLVLKNEKLKIIFILRILRSNPYQTPAVIKIYVKQQL